MKRVGKMECCALESKRGSDNSRLVSVAMTQQRRAQCRKSRILSYETLVNGWCGNDDDLRTCQDLLESSGVMVGVAMSNDDTNNHSWPNTLPLECCRGIWRRINHHTTSIHPKNISRDRSALIEAVRVAKDSDAKGRRVKSRREYWAGYAGWCPRSKSLLHLHLIKLFILGIRQSITLPPRCRRKVVHKGSTAKAVDAHCFRYLYVPRETGLANNFVVFINVMENILPTTRHFCKKDELRRKESDEVG